MTDLNILKREVFDLAYSLFTNPGVNGTRNKIYGIVKDYQEFGNEEQREKIREYNPKKEE